MSFITGGHKVVSDSMFEDMNLSKGLTTKKGIVGRIILDNKKYYCNDEN